MIFLVLVIKSAGFGGLLRLLSNTWQFIIGIVGIVLQFPSELGLTDYVTTWVFFGIVTAVSGALGIWLTKTKRKRIFAFCSDAVAFVSGILTIVSAIKR